MALATPLTRTEKILEDLQERFLNLHIENGYNFYAQEARELHTVFNTITENNFILKDLKPIQKALENLESSNTMQGLIQKQMILVDDFIEREQNVNDYENR